MKIIYHQKNQLIRKQTFQLIQILWNQQLKKIQLNNQNMTQSYVIPAVSAGSSDFISQLYSQQKLNKDVVDTLAAKLSLILPHKNENSVLIIGGKCGLTAQLLLPFCSKIDIVQEQPYLALLRQRFVNHKDVKYTFNRQGDIGQEHIRPKPDLNKCKVNVFEMQTFDKSNHGKHSYNIVLLQNVLINEKMNILEQLMRIQHQVLITMIIPGKLAHNNLFELLAGIEKNILTVFYQHELHERLQNAKYITGRKQQLLFWEIFIWKKKPAGQQGSMHIIHQIKDILKKQIHQNAVQKKRIEKESKTFQSKEIAQRYRQFHYNDQQYFFVRNFPKVCSQKAIHVAQQQKLTGRALDLGCSVGRTSIQLASKFEQVVGVDLSHAFIEQANNVLSSKFADLTKKVRFMQGDACKLDESLGKFSLIFCQNLIDRISDPESFLVNIGKFLETNGVLILTSPYTWSQDFTPKPKWLGGYSKDGMIVTSHQGLSNVLTKHGFKQLQAAQDIRFVMRQNPWVFQYTLNNITYWKKVQ